MSGFADRILPVNMAVVEHRGRMNAIRPVPAIDALLAATAKVNGLTLVTRNVADVSRLDVDVLNPFEVRPFVRRTASQRLDGVSCT